VYQALVQHKDPIVNHIDKTLSLSYGFKFQRCIGWKKDKEIKQMAFSDGCVWP
jgi:hypothetical protein